ncbi:nitrate reductase [Shewanella sp. 30m-9]
MNTNDNHDKGQELTVVLLLAVVVGPLATSILISIYGFIVWFSQILTSPPGPTF